MPACINPRTHVQREVTLETEEGELLARVLIPIFSKPVEVLFWNCRVFSLYNGSRPMIYREVFAYAVQE